MSLRPVFLLAALAFAAGPAAAQQGYKPKDARKAEKLAGDDRDFRGLTPEEQHKVIEAIALQVHAARRKVTRAYIITRKGTSVEELEKKKVGGYRLVSATQDKEPAETPARTTMVAHEIASKPFGKLFADNDWEIQDGSPDAEALRRQANAVVDLVKKTDGRVVSIHVESSASTLKNTGKAAKMTHEELSRRRAESAADFVTKVLAERGIVLDDDQVTLDYSGANGNGTSGPSSPFPCADPKLCAQGSCAAPAELSDAVKAGDLGDAVFKKISTVYDPYKYVQVGFVVANETADEKPGVSAPGEAHAVLVAVGYKERTRVRWPRIHLKLPRLTSRKKNWGSTKCPRF